MPAVAVRRKPDGAPFDSFPHQLFHALDFFRGCRTLRRFVTQHVLTDGNVPHQPGYVYAQPTIQAVEIITVRMPAPVDALLQDGARDRLDANEALYQRIFISVLYRR